MCGIAGLYTKSATLREHLGAHLADMLEQLSDRGPDSAGVAFYRDAAPPGWCKVSLHSHPFSTGLDLCLVHNGSLSNHNRLRRSLSREGIRFRTDCDSEVAAGYLTWRLREGATLEQALEGCLDDLDGFYTFAVGTADGFAVLRDPIACKPAVMAETDEWVAMASEYRAIAVLPGAEDAVTWEPAPGHVYSWGTASLVV